MLENLNEMVRENVQESVVNNTAIPNEHNEAVIQAASGSIFDSLKNQLSSGNIGALTDIFNGNKAEGTQVAEQASGSFIDKLSRLGINADTAKSLAASIIPGLIAKFTQKTNDPNDSSFNLKDVLGSLGGNDGKFDVSDVIGMFNGGKQTTQTGQTGEGGIMDKLKGMFG
ncbi:hypothetical protein ACTJKC_17485 [Pedobacter sp. 22226]|uniref:hypothetical protein n=1 Tax=Pedobacter sp. 22226 TaxID=3453894 RepID=UPI003F8347F4